MGWICPRCGRVYGPAVTECGACNAAMAQFPVISWHWRYDTPDWLLEPWGGPKIMCGASNTGGGDDRAWGATQF